MARIIDIFRQPPAYVARTRWPWWAAVAAAILFFAGATAAGALVAHAYGSLLRPRLGLSQEQAQIQQLLVSLVGLQAALVGVTVWAARLFHDKAVDTLALRPPAQGIGIYPAALLIMVVLVALTTALGFALSPQDVIGDVQPFARLMRSHSWWLTLVAVGVGAPLSEELVFRGFLFSAIARSRAGVMGAGIATSIAWTLLHAGYSVHGLVEVFAIGLYFSWLLWRTGSLWVPIACHAAYNTALVLALRFIPLPSG